MSYNNYDIEKRTQQEAAEKQYYKLQTDRLKHRSFVFSRYPLVNKHSIEMNDIRSFVYADVHARYLSYKGENVLFNVGINNTSKKLYENSLNNVLSKEDPYSSIKENSYNDFYSMDIGFDQEKNLESHNKDFIYFIQNAFLKLKDNKYIIKEKEQYYLDISSIKNEVILQIKKDKMYDNLKEYLEYESGLRFTFNTTINEGLSIDLNQPAFMSGINFITLNPNYENVYKYYFPGEVEYIKASLKKKKSMGVFSGTFAINPMTGIEIPIIISSFFKEDIHVGIPSVSNDDLLFSSIFGLQYNHIIKEEENKKTLINSGFLDGLSIDEAHNTIIDAITSEELGEFYELILKNKILISYEFNNGISIPAYETDYLSEQELPVLIDGKNNVRTVKHKLSQNKITKQVFTPQITQAFLSIAARTKTKIGIATLTSKEFIYDFKDFPCFDYAIFYSETEYLHTLIINMIILKMFNLDSSNIFNKVYIEGNFYDATGLELLRENNNLIDLKGILSRYGACSLRMNMLSTSIVDNFYNNNDEMVYAAQQINNFTKIFEYKFISEYKDLNKDYNNLITNATRFLLLNQLSLYIKELIEFIDKVHTYKKITSKQAKGLLILFSIIAPSICEQIYKDTFNATYPLIYEAWPE